MARANLLMMPTNVSIQAARCFSTKPQFLNLNFSSFPLHHGFSRNTALSLTHCSAKPNTDKDDSATGNLSAGTGSVSGTESQASFASNQGLSSTRSVSRGLIFDLGSKDSWDGFEIGSPVVKRYLSDEEERWCMWYYGRSVENPDSDSIGLAVSSNGIHWERGGEGVRSNADLGLVMSCSRDWWAFDTQSVRPCEVAVMSSTKVRTNSAVYWLYYTGFTFEKMDLSSSNSLEFCSGNPDNVHFLVDNDNQKGDGRKILRSLPGLAMSQDGRHWARIEGDHHSGALLDVGSDGEWDSVFIASSHVVFHGNGDLRMYYHSLDVTNGEFAVGMARSRDGMRWVKLGKIMGGGADGAFDECGRVNPRVLRNKKDGKYLMVYEGVACGGKRSIGMAVSSDGLKDWENVQEGPVLEQSKDNEWDCEGVGMPYLVRMEGGGMDEWRLYYRGIGKGGKTGIGLAVCQGTEVNNFKRWTGFHL